MRGRNWRTRIVLRTYEWQRVFETRWWSLSEKKTEKFTTVKVYYSARTARSKIFLFSVCCCRNKWFYSDFLKMQYRLQQFTEIQKLLESERQKREKLNRNYKKCLQAVKATEAVFSCIVYRFKHCKCRIFIYHNYLSCSHGNRSRVTRSWTSFHCRRIC